MSGLWVIARREYRETVRKKSFVIVTVLMPLLFGASMIVPRILLTRGMAEKKVLVLDATHKIGAGIQTALTDPSELSNRIQEGAASITLEIAPGDAIGSDLPAALDRLSAKDVDVVLTIEPTVLVGHEGATYYSRSATDVITRQLISSTLNRAVIESRAHDLGVDAARTTSLLQHVEMSVQQHTSSGTSKSGGESQLFLALAFAMLMFIPTIIHGQEIMRGVVQEKSDRIVESLVSSMSAFDLLSGKVLGMAAVGLTQIAIWVVLGSLAGVFAAAPLLAADIHLLDLVTPVKIFWFLIFFLLGYLMSACIYAAGGACASSEKEAQQALMPIMFVMMMPLYLIGPIVMDAESKLAVVMSLIPIYTPITMFVRIIVGEPPIWHIALSIVLSILSILGLFWLSSRIYRVGILWYGKRPSLPELLRWVREP